MDRKKSPKPAETTTHRLDEAQFKQFDLGIDGISGALNVLSSRIGPVSKNKSLHQAIVDGFTELNKTVEAGFKLVAEAVAKGQTLPPPQQKPLEVIFVFKVSNDHQDEPYSISIGGVTDKEGEPLPDTKGLIVEVTSSDEAVVAAGFDPTTNSGMAHFGRSGVASLNAVVKNARGDILGSGAADFTVTTGDPAAVSDVKIAFSGISEESTEPPVES